MSFCKLFHSKLQRANDENWTLSNAIRIKLQTVNDKKIILQELTSTFFRHVIRVNPLPPGRLRQFFFCFYFFACSFVYFKFLILPNQKLICC